MMAADKQAGPDVSAREGAAAALKSIGELTGRETVGVASLEPTDTGWRVGVEVLEESRIPSSGDILAVYETDISLDGDLLSYRRVRRYLRGDTHEQGGRS